MSVLFQGLKLRKRYIALFVEILGQLTSRSYSDDFIFLVEVGKIYEAVLGKDTWISKLSFPVEHLKSFCQSWIFRLLPWKGWRSTKPRWLERIVQPGFWPLQEGCLWWLHLICTCCLRCTSFYFISPLLLRELKPSNIPKTQTTCKLFSTKTWWNR